MAPLQNPSGFWEPKTSTLDWCENNYEFSYYIAEFWNTLTNLAMIVPALKGLYEVRRQKFESWFSNLYLLLLITGIGSWMFHMTLRYTSQLMDELPMVWGSAYMVYCLHRVRRSPQEKTTKVAVLVSAYTLIVTIMYIVTKNFTVFEASYGILVFLMLSHDLRLNTHQKTKVGLQIFITGLFMYGIGFALWNVDNRFCDNLKHIRSSLPYGFLAPLTQLHGWWHLLAGYASYLHIQSLLHHRQKFLKDDIVFKITWMGIEGMRKEDSPATKEHKLK